MLETSEVTLLLLGTLCVPFGEGGLLWILKVSMSKMGEWFDVIFKVI